MRHRFWPIVWADTALVKHWQQEGPMEPEEGYRYIADITIRAEKIDRRHDSWMPMVLVPAESSVFGSDGLGMVAAECHRQLTEEGFTAEHDDTHVNGELALAGAVYAIHSTPSVDRESDKFPMLWPWQLSWWKPTTPLRDLVKGAALLIAEINRRVRLERRLVDNPSTTR